MQLKIRHLSLWPDEGYVMGQYLIYGTIFDENHKHYSTTLFFPNYCKTLNAVTDTDMIFLKLLFTAFVIQHFNFSNHTFML